MLLGSTLIKDKDEQPKSSRSAITKSAATSKVMEEHSRIGRRKETGSATRLITLKPESKRKSRSRYCYIATIVVIVMIISVIAAAIFLFVIKDDVFPKSDDDSMNSTISISPPERKKRDPEKAYRIQNAAVNLAEMKSESRNEYCYPFKKLNSFIFC